MRVCRHATNMKQSLKIVVLLLVFVLPIGIFVFLKLFGRNEFDVAPLYVNDTPRGATACGFTPELPYHVPDSIQQLYNLRSDSLTVIFFGPLSGEGRNQLDRVREQTGSDPVNIIEQQGTDALSVASDAQVTIRSDIPASDEHRVREQHSERLKQCIFYLDSGMNVVMLDRKGAIRGQYIADDRDEIDRMLTEIAIILKKY